MTEDQFWDISCLHNKIDKMETLKRSLDLKDIRIYYNTKSEDSYGNFIGDDIKAIIGEDNVIKMLSDFVDKKLEASKKEFSKMKLIKEE